MKEIEEFKAENGGVISYTVKELVAGLHTKVDKLNEKFDCHDRKITILKTLVGIHTFLIIGLLWVVLT